jgi:hypothetical protein
MSDQVAGVFVTVDIVIPRLSPSGSGGPSPILYLVLS